MTVVSESLVHAKSEARQAESRVALAEAINRFDRRTADVAFWIIGTMIAFNLATLGIIIALRS